MGSASGHRKLPVSARVTYFHDVRSAIFYGARMGAVCLAGLVARKSLEAPDWQLALVGSFSMGGLFLSVWWAKLAAARRKMPLVVSAQLAGALLMGLVAFATRSLGFVLLAGVSALVFSASRPAVSTIQRVNYPPTHRAGIVGSINALTLVAMAVVAAAFGAVLRADPGAYRYLFPAAAVLGALGTLRFGRIRVRGERRGALTSRRASFAAMLGILREDARFRSFLASFFISGFAAIMTTPVLIMVIEDDLGLPYDKASWIVAAVPMLVMALSSVLVGRALDRVNPLLARAAVTAVWVLDPLMVLVAMATRSIVPLIVGKTIFGAVLAGEELVWALGVNYFARREDVPVYQGIHMTLTGVRGMLAPFAGIALARLAAPLGPTIGGRRYVFIFAAMLLVLSTLIMVALALRDKAAGRLGLFAHAEAASDGDPRKVP